MGVPSPDLYPLAPGWEVETLGKEHLRDLIAPYRREGIPQPAPHSASTHCTGPGSPRYLPLAVRG